MSPLYNLHATQSSLPNSPEAVGVGLCTHWSERSACNQRSKLRLATNFGINLLFFLLSPPLFKTPEGVVVGFQIVALAPNSQKYCDSYQVISKVVLGFRNLA